MSPRKTFQLFFTFLFGSFCINALVTDEKLFFNGNQSDSVIRVGKGQSAVLECRAGGIPAPVINWFHNGIRIDQDRSTDEDESTLENQFNSNEMQMLRLSSTQSRLFLDCISESSAGEYICVAESTNKRLRIQRTINVILQNDHHHHHQQQQHQHHNQLPHHQSGNNEVEEIENVVANVDCLNRLSSAAANNIPARIYMWTDQRLEYEGATVQLFCRASGHPTPRIHWMDGNNQPIRGDSGKYKILKNGDLIIFNLKWSTDMGQFWCIAKNDNGEDVTEMFLYPTKP